jgi:hypothetical protein
MLMRLPLVSIMACLVAALVPFLPVQTGPPRPPALAFPGWPAHFAGRALHQVPLSAREQRFDTGFPGQVARFTDGQREIIVRWVTQETRKLHPSTDCLKGVGYTIQPLPLWTDPAGNRWGCALAQRGAETLRVCERIAAHLEPDIALPQGAEVRAGWADVSSWYWAAFFGQTHGPWWAVTVAEKWCAPRHWPGELWEPGGAGSGQLQVKGEWPGCEGCHNRNVIAITDFLDKDGYLYRHEGCVRVPDQDNQGADHEHGRSPSEEE